MKKLHCRVLINLFVNTEYVNYYNIKKYYSKIALKIIIHKV